MEFRHIRTDRRTAFDSGRDTAHEVYSNDLFKRFGAELHRFVNGGGQACSAIYRGDLEEMSAPREDEDGMIRAFQQRVYVEKFGKSNIFM